jgi:hypothetical protein
MKPKKSSQGRKNKRGEATDPRNVDPDSPPVLPRLPIKTRLSDNVEMTSGGFIGGGLNRLAGTRREGPESGRGHETEEDKEESHEMETARFDWLNKMVKKSESKQMPQC